MDIFQYLALAASAWMVGFLPVSEILIAVPAALLTGLDHVSVVFWTVFGNFMPIILIHFGYEQLMRIERVRGWLEKLLSERLQQRVNQYGIWMVLLLTPFVGTWGMSLTAKVLRMEPYRFMAASLISLIVYAILLVVLISAGVNVVSGA